MELYDVLGVSKDATKEEIKKAYRRRAKEEHPDQGGEPGAFHKVNTAWKVLGDSEQRARYDKTGEYDSNSKLNDIEKTPGRDSLAEAYKAVIEERGEAGSLLQALTGKSGKRSFKLFTKDSLTLAMDKFLAEGLEGGTKLVEEMEDHIKRTQGYLDRLKRRKTSKESDIIAGIIKNEQAQMEIALAKMSAQLEDIKAARKLLEGYDYEVDAPEPVQTQAPLREYRHIDDFYLGGGSARNSPYKNM